MTRDEAKQLLDKYLMGIATPEEQALVERAYALYGQGRTGALTHFDSEKLLLDTLGTSLLEHAQKNGARSAHTPEQELPGKRRLQWWPYAAAVAIFLMVGWLFLDWKHETSDARLAGTEILPGGNRATLTLSDGRVVELSGAQEGIVIGDGITYIDGSGVFESSDRHIGSLKSHASNLMSITTPKGGTYQVTLPDGSKVWLNAASTLKYPERFDGTERVVELEGEAFFEVRQQRLDNGQQTKKSLVSSVSNLKSQLPFKVQTNGQTVEVLGTSFNISAYRNEPDVKTTLVSGLVQVSVVGAKTTKGSPKANISSLQPGEQAILSNGNITKQQVDVSEFTAWKDGYFIRTGAMLADVIPALERWYDVEFEIDKLPVSTAYVALSREAKLSEILEALKVNYDVRFQIKGRRVVAIE